MSTTTVSPTKNNVSQIGQQFRSNFQTYALVVAMIVIWVLFFFLTNGIYLSPQNFSNLFRQMTITAVLSVGMVLVIVAGHIDLSVGKLAGFVSVVVAYLQAYTWNKYLPGAPPGLTTTLSVLCGLRYGHPVRRHARMDHRLPACAILHYDSGAACGSSMA